MFFLFFLFFRFFPFNRMASSRIDNTAETARRIRLAGYQRLLSHINVDPPLIDQTHIMKLAEHRVYEYTKTLTPAQLREGTTVYNSVSTILAPFEFRVKPSYLGLWRFVSGVPDSAETIKTHLEALQTVSYNNKLKRLIPPQLQTIAKYTGIVKHVLNVGKPFNSLFDEVDLTKAEIIQRDYVKGADLEARSSLEALLEGITFAGDENALLRAFYGNVEVLTDPVLRNTYFNRILLLLIPRIGRDVRLVSLFAQLYCHLVNKELVTTVDPAVARYLSANPIDFFSHSLQHMGLVLEPHSNFKRPTLVLEEWQRECVRSIRTHHNVLVSAPPSAGKTFVSTEVINACEDGWYVVPTRPLADQLAGILLATLEDNEKRVGVTARNLRLEVDSVTAYRRFHRARDNLVVATPARMWDLIRAKQAPPPPRYIILDEFHNISCPVLGPYYEALFLYAAFHRIRVVALTGTMKASDFEPMRTWFEATLPGPLYAVMIQKRFFNQRRVVFRCDGDRVSVATLDPLDHLRVATIRDAAFRHPGLVPSAVLRLYNKLPSFPRMDERVPVLPTLDDVDSLEGRLFHHVASQPDAVLSELLKELPVSSDALTLDQIHATLCTMDVQWKPLLFFKMDPHACMRFFQKFIHFIQDKNKLVYGDFQGDQPLIAQYLEEMADLTEAEKADEKDDCSEKAMENALRLRLKFESIYQTKWLPRLTRWYREYQTPKEDPVRLAEFCTKYGVTMTHDYILAKRAEHVAEQLSKKYDMVRLRKNYEIHDKMKISTYSEGGIMKSIRDQFNDELAHYRKHHGPFKAMDAEFDEFNDIEETRSWTKKEKKAAAEAILAGVKKAVKKEEFTETRRIGRPWHSSGDPFTFEGAVVSDDDEGWEYTYKIPYTHPILVAAECGVLFYNELLNPALSYMCLLLISRHPLVAISDKTLTSGVNFPFKSVWIQGGLKGEPIETIDNTTAFQGMGRAGRRGLEKEATIITNGVDIPSILTPQYNPVTRNDAKRMEEVLDSELRHFARTGERPATAVAATGATGAAAAAATAAATVAAAGATGVAAVDISTGSWEDYVVA